MLRAITRSVVCGVDGSPESHRAVDVARWLASGLDARPILVHVVEDRPTFPYGDKAASARAAHASWRAAHKVFAGLVDDAEPEEETEVLSGEPGAALANAATEHDALAVVVGSRGRGPLRAALLGSTSHSAVRECECPVVIVPSTAVTRSPSRGTSLVCGVDGTEHSHNALRAAAELRARLGLHLVLVRVQVFGSTGGWMAAPVEGAGSGVAAEERIEVGEVCDRLDRTAVEEDARLIVIGARGLGALAGAVLGSVSARLAACASRPIMVVREGVSLKGSPGRRSGYGTEGLRFES